MIVKHAANRVKQLGSQAEREVLLQKAIAAARTLGSTAKAKEFEASLYAISPRLRPNPPENLWLSVAEDFRANEEWTAAQTFYDKMLSSNRTNAMDHYRALDGIREIHKAKFRFYSEPVGLFLQASKITADYCEGQVRTSAGLSFNDRRVLFEAWIQYARDEWSYGDVNIAKREITRLLNFNWVDPVFKSFALWTEARIHANNGDWNESAQSGAAGARILNNDLGNSKNWTKWHWNLWDEVLWSTSMANRKIQQWSTASQWLELAMKHTRNPSAQLKFQFWLGQSLKDQNLTSQASTAFRQLMGDDPHGFYGFLAHRELGESLSALPDLDLQNIAKPPSVSTSDFNLMIGLVQADELLLAQKLSQRVLPANSVEPVDLFMRAFVHDYATIQNLFFSRIAAANRNAFISKYARLFYPMPYHDLVEAAVQKNPRVEKEYVYSIMRQESAFNPYSHSWANAYGLLQLLPKVARETMAKAGVTFNEDFELYRPEINIPIGTAHMDDLIDRAGPTFILRTSSYNATVEKTLEWRQRLYQGNVYEFLEEVPYEETRSYIRLVMRNYLMNRRLNAKQPFAFPADLLNL
jgi:soluble lytic murein transglycosylase